ncbi:MAG: 50S ribosomal protein L35 [Gammaproteobacteria bacterium]|nr:50S ribosomal protein L35 [Gammaproteobacteria bacterium]
MPKLKTSQGAAKRFRKTANGLKRRQAFKRHILTKMSSKRKRNLRGCTMVCKSDELSIKRLLLLA